jgi:hypothetical protein
MQHYKMRQQIARRLGDDISGTASGGSTTTLTATGDISRLPTSPSALTGAEISTIQGTNAGQARHITGHSVLAGTVTLTVPTWSAPDSTTTYEIHRLNGRGFTKAQYDDAIWSAIDDLEDDWANDYSAVPMAFEVRAVLQGETRTVYPMPSGFNRVYGVDFLGIAPHTGCSSAFRTTYRALGDASARTKLWQSFQVQQTGWYEWFSLHLAKVGSPTDNLSLTIMTTSGGLPSAAVTDGTCAVIDGSTLNENSRYLPFQATNKVFLTKDTTYALVLSRSGATDGNNYYRWSEDDQSQGSDHYTLGSAGTYNGSAYSAVTGSDFCFQVFRAHDEWKALRQKVGWQYKRVDGGAIYIPYVSYDGVPIRIRGLAPVERTSAETDTIPIPTDYCEAFAIRHLMSGYVGRALPDNYAQAAAFADNILTKRRRPVRALPPNG